MSRVGQKYLSCGLALFGVTSWVHAAAAPTSPPSTMTVQQRIDALLKRRLKAGALPVNLPNPFQFNTGALRSADDNAARLTAEINAVSEEEAARPAKNAPANDDLSIPTQATVQLKVGGIIVLKDRLQVVVNGSPRKEGDSVAADWNNALIYLQIIRLSPGPMVLRYGEAEATLKF